MPHFEYNEQEVELSSAPSDILETYEPTHQQQAEDNIMVIEFTNNLHDTLHDSKEHINNVSATYSFLQSRNYNTLGLITWL